VVVDGKVQSMAVDPTKALLDPAGPLSLLQSTLASSLSGDPGATVSVGVANNKVAISVTGAGSSHTISFGAAGDSSNFLSLMNLSTVQGTTTSGALSLHSSALVGVTQTNQSLATAGLATGINAPSGAFAINGVQISFNAATDSINSVLSAINNSTAGVVAGYNSITDRVTLTNKNTGQSAITMQDVSGNFLAAMNLAPGTTNAQQLGANASVTVNGATIASPSNTITSAVPGMSIKALATTTSGSPATVTVAPDTAAITKSIQGYVDAANKVLNDITATQQKDLSTGQYGALFGDSYLTGLRNHILTLTTGQVTSSGAYRSLQDIGITTGAVGSKLDTTSSLLLDTAKLTAALAANPGQVAALFNGTTANNGFTGAAQQINRYLQQQTNAVNGPFALYQTNNNTQIKNMQVRITQLQTQLSAQRRVLTVQFTAMSTALSNLSAESAALGYSSSSSSSSTSGG